MFDNVLGRVSRFLRSIGGTPPTQRGTTPQGQAKLDAMARKPQSQPQTGTPAGRAKLEAQKQASISQTAKPAPFTASEKPAGYEADEPLSFGTTQSTSPYGGKAPGKL